MRSGSNLDESQAGSVLGTPAYMAPEQAAGETGFIDRRAERLRPGLDTLRDFDRAASLYGTAAVDVLRSARCAETADAADGTAGWMSAEAELIDLAKDCLAVEREHRPRDAGLVAERMTAYLAGVQKRLQAAERNVRWPSRKRLRSGGAGRSSCAGGVGSGADDAGRPEYDVLSSATSSTGRRRTAHRRSRDHAPGPASAGTTSNSPGHRLAAVEQSDPAGDPKTKAQLLDLQKDIQAGLEAARRDQKLLDRVVDIRSAETDDQDGSITEHDYADAFREARIDLATLTSEPVGEKIKARPASVVSALAGALDDWAAIRQGKRANARGAAKLREAARVADPDPRRNDLRAALNQPDDKARLTRLQAVAKTANFAELGPISLHLLGAALVAAGDNPQAESVLRKAQERHPRDVWVNYMLGSVLEKLARRDEAIRFYTAARAIRPETAHASRHALEDRGDSSGAIAVFRDLNALRPEETTHLACLAKVFEDSRLLLEARVAYKAAAAAGRQAIQKRPHDATAHFDLGLALLGTGDLDQAIAELREGIRLKPDELSGRLNLGTALKDQGKLDEAIAEYRTLIRLKPGLALAHYNLGIVHDLQWEPRRGHRRIPRGDPGAAGLRRRPLAPRRRPGQAGEIRRGGCRVSHGHPAQTHRWLPLPPGRST